MYLFVFMFYKKEYRERDIYYKLDVVNFLKNVRCLLWFVVIKIMFLFVFFLNKIYVNNVFVIRI